MKLGIRLSGGSSLLIMARILSVMLAWSYCGMYLHRAKCVRSSFSPHREHLLSV